MNNGKKQWFYLNLGQRRGPVSKEKLCELIERKEIYYSDVQVWKEGMKEWLPVSKVRSFAGSIKKVSTPSSSTVDTSEAKERQFKEQDSHLGGLNRFGYNLYFYIGWPIVYLFGLIAAKEMQIYDVINPNEPHQAQWLPFIPWILVAIVSLTATAARVRNAGYAGAWCLGLIVPILNLWVLLVSLCGPTNHRRRRRLGMGGLVCFLVCVVITLGSIIINMGEYHLNVDGLKSRMMSYYASWTKLESRQNREYSERAVEKQEEQERDRELQESGRDGREKTEREIKVESATQGVNE